MAELATNAGQFVKFGDKITPYQGWMSGIYKGTRDLDKQNQAQFYRDNPWMSDVTPMGLGQWNQYLAKNPLERGTYGDLSGINQQFSDIDESAWGNYAGTLDPLGKAQWGRSGGQFTNTAFTPTQADVASQLEGFGTYQQGIADQEAAAAKEQSRQDFMALNPLAPEEMAFYNETTGGWQLDKSNHVWKDGQWMTPEQAKIVTPDEIQSILADMDLNPEEGVQGLVDIYGGDNLEFNLDFNSFLDSPASDQAGAPSSRPARTLSIARRTLWP